jgi:hypothetical protein
VKTWKNGKKRKKRKKYLKKRKYLKRNLKRNGSYFQKIFSFFLFNC